ncbi:phosphoribosylformylglycinamidine synthase subunit PurQ [Albimonas sp. CAU 1670]|uniref:phosphoribosylformylglycinamidine synthase subunit PurQ n=1 Tax=Albimonas sp. CAU 1670 TaxID=3032599 RepID=UPI0023D9C3F8|nr:phosphoribosylformylglycinamidine synthase subunit PurQ [Albimonas sp. CAU 1670]MDF2232909.1 phosphoribosylformylglycinamidine synthase subunit PurQ [Albimonas sp. CAU 1670]
MRAAVIVFPGSNCDRDMQVALQAVASAPVEMVWHKDTSLPKGLDLVALPGGFSFGDHLRCGAIAGKSPIMRAVSDFAHAGGHVLGVCNGFQILTETGLLPGALLRNGNLKFLCKPVALTVKTSASPFTSAWNAGDKAMIPIAHHDGAYVADPETLKALEGEDRVAFTYADGAPNGAVHDIAGVLSENRRVLGMMPHPERAVDAAHGGTDGAPLFRSLADALVSA